MRPRIVLTKAELESVIAVAGDAIASETLRDPDASEADNARAVDAYFSGMEKLREMLWRKTP